MSKKEHKEEKNQETPPAEGETTLSANGDGVSATSVPVEKIEKEETSDLSEKLDELNDRYLRLYSDFDNYRRRTLKDIGDIRKNASEDLVVKLLPVLDDFERAIKAFNSTENAQALKEGILLIFNKFMTTLTIQGLEQMKTIGEKFDTDFHEAITNIPVSNEEMKNKVVDEIEKGYLLYGKVIRYAKVVVGS
ncbi:MAG: nucleotide exchange factor GrpE [Bacteroidetes bacterium]|nr:nucleotide exchange factor GrpE [Bacteroidota bacterium]